MFGSPRRRDSRPPVQFFRCSPGVRYTSFAGRGPPNSPNFLLGKWPRLPFTARDILTALPRARRDAPSPVRAQFHPARSASKKGIWPLPTYHFQGARSGSTGPMWVSFQLPQFTKAWKGFVKMRRTRPVSHEALAALKTADCSITARRP